MASFPFCLNNNGDFCINIKQSDYMLQFYNGMFIIIPIGVVNKYRPFPPPRIQYNNYQQISYFTPLDCIFNENLWLCYVIDKNLLYKEYIRFYNTLNVESFDDLKAHSEKNIKVWYNFDLNDCKTIIIVSIDKFTSYLNINKNIKCIPYFQNYILYSKQLLPLYAMFLAHLYECENYLKSLINNIDYYSKEHELIFKVLSIIDDDNDV